MGLQAIEFTNSKEADQSIQELLPPKEVITSTNILMQESESVFELVPGERVQVFKHLFGLLGIDEAKEKLNERRKELQTTIQVKWDQSHASHKLNTQLTSFREILPRCENLLQWLHASTKENILETQRKKAVSTGFFADLDLIQHDIGIDEFSFNQKDYWWFEEILKLVDKEVAAIHILQGQEEERKKQQLQINQSFTAKQAEVQNIKQKLETITQKIQQQTLSDHTKLLDQRTTLVSDAESLEKKLPFDTFAKAWYDVKNSSELSLQLHTLITQWTSEAQNLKQISREITQTKERLKELTSESQQLKTQYEQLKESNEKQHRFDCDKIDGACPYVQLINKNAVWAMDKQLENILQKEKMILEKSETLRTTDLPSLEKQEEQAKKAQETLKTFLTDISWKTTQETCKNISDQQEKIRELDMTIKGFESELEQAKLDQQTKLTLETQLKEVVKQEGELSAQLKSFENLSSTPAQDLSSTSQDLQEVKTQLELLIKHAQQLELLVDDATKHKKEIKILEEKLVITKDLYQIFNKELMVVVLQDFLPALQEILNSFLAQIVEYEVRFLTPDDSDSTWGQLELDIQIIDNKGTRSVKSLSWGQKTILKLVRMLSVASLFKSEFLLLDETINNLDTETISQVADVLEDFVTSQNLSFYVVTHSPQIQEMGIWESVVSI